MKILIVCSATKGNIAPFILDQVESLKLYDIQIDFYLIRRVGVWGYLSQYLPLLKKIEKYKPHIVHAHYGLSGVLATLQPKVPVVITFHGSDINLKKVRYLSWIASRLSRANVIVAKSLLSLLPAPNAYVIPCGVNLCVFKPVEKAIAKEKLNLSIGKKYILFSSHFENKIKNYSLAAESIGLLNNNSIELLELKNYSRIDVALLMNSVDLVLLTSFTEGSPQFIKEAMACNCPVVSTDVGDVRQNIESIEGCYLTSFLPEDVAQKIDLALKLKKRTNGREKIIEMGLDSETVAKQIVEIYKKVLKLESD